MGKHADWYLKRSEEGKNFFILAAIAVLGLLVFVFGFFIDQPGLPLGWLLGSVIELFGYVTIVKGASFLLGTGNSKKGYLMALFSALRLLLYASGLLLAALCTYYWKNNILNLWTVFGAYVPMAPVVLITQFAKIKKNAAKPAEPENKEETK